MFKNRQEAGRLLAKKLSCLKDKNPIVLAIPRGGVVIGREIAQFLGCPLDIIVTKKIGAPKNPELAIGAVGPEGIKVIDKNLCQRVGAADDYLKIKTEQLKKEIIIKEKILRQKQKPLSPAGKTVILTDDGVATGSTVEAGIKFLKTKKPKKIILAVPVLASDTLERLLPLVDELIYLEAPWDFWAVGQFYQEFPQVEDKEVIKILASLSIKGQTRES